MSLNLNKPTIAFYTLGCKVNFSESSFIAAEITANNWHKTSFHEQADVYVIHSCILTSQAEKKTRNAIARAHRKNPFARIVVIGCVSQLQANELLKLPGVTHVLGNVSKFKLKDIIEEPAQHKFQPTSDDVHHQPAFHISWSVNDRTRSFLKIQDGCDCYCNYCIVPFARGKSRSATINEVIEATAKITDAGFQEIVLTGINLGDFGKQNNESLSDVLFQMSQNKHLKRIRISSLEPQHFTDELFDALPHLPKVMPHFHIPVQSGCNETLQRMGRQYTTADIEHICKKLIQLNADVCIAADIMTGFPGESEKEFQDGYYFLQNLPLTYMHVFTFSARKNTIAASMPHQVHPSEKKYRTARLLELSATKKAAFYNRSIGQTRPLLAESENKKGMMYGYTDNYIRVKLPFQKNAINKILDVKLTDFDHSDHTFHAEIIKIYE